KLWRSKCEGSESCWGGGGTPRIGGLDEDTIRSARLGFWPKDEWFGGIYPIARSASQLESSSRGSMTWMRRFSVSAAPTETPSTRWSGEAVSTASILGARVSSLGDRW